MGYDRLKAAEQFDQHYTVVENRGFCVYCYQPEPETVDHVYPLFAAFTQGVEAVPKDCLLIVPCCFRCNSFAGVEAFPSFLEKKQFVIKRRATEDGVEYPSPAVILFSPEVSVWIEASLKPLCAQCGIEFPPNREWQKFCGKACRERWYKGLRDALAAARRTRRNVDNAEREALRRQQLGLK